MYSEVEPEAAYSEVEVEEGRHGRRSSARFAPRLSTEAPAGHQGEGFADAVLRGLGQVVFQNNPLTGLLILLAISVNSFVYAGAALFGAVVGTYVAMLLRIDNKLVRDGLFGFNGALTAIAMVGVHQQRARPRRSAEPLDDPLYRARSGLLDHSCPRLRVRDQERPRSRAELSVLRRDADATRRDAPVRRRRGGRTASVTGAPQVYAGDTWLYGIATGISQIFLQDNWLTGIVVVAAIAVNLRIAAAAVTAGAALAVATGCFLGASEAVIRSGALGYNAALTALALGGFFVLLDLRGRARLEYSARC